MCSSKHGTSTDSVQSRVAQIYSLCEGLDIKQFLSGWFKGVQFEDLRRDNVKEFFAYGVWWVPDKWLRLMPLY
jgi:hypothetical protein